MEEAHCYCNSIIYRLPFRKQATLKALDDPTKNQDNGVIYVVQIIKYSTSVDQICKCTKFNPTPIRHFMTSDTYKELHKNLLNNFS